MRMLQQGASLQELYNYVRELENKVSRLQVVGDNRTTSVTRTNAGQIVHALPQRMNGFVSGGGGGVVATYNGPFACSYDQANNRILINDGITVAGNSAYGASYQGLKYPVSCSTLATGKGYVVCHMYVTYSSVWNRRFEVYNNQNYYTAQTNVGVGYDYRHFYCTLASFDYDADTPAVNNLIQWQFGDIHIAGRAT